MIVFCNHFHLVKIIFKCTYVGKLVLNVFLKLKQSGNECVTKKNIQNQLPNISTFENNFNQMKMITKHNHGKIFEETNGYIEIWEPVRLLVSKYEQEIFKQ